MALTVGLEHEWQADRLSYFEAVPDGEELGCVVVMHGGGPGDNKGRNLSLAQDLVGYGYRVLGLDFTGSGESAGEWSDLTLNPGWGWGPGRLADPGPRSGIVLAGTHRFQHERADGRRPG